MQLSKKNKIKLLQQTIPSFQFIIPSIGFYSSVFPVPLKTALIFVLQTAVSKVFGNINQTNCFILSFFFMTEKICGILDVYQTQLVPVFNNT